MNTDPTIMRLTTALADRYRSASPLRGLGIRRLHQVNIPRNVTACTPGD